MATYRYLCSLHGWTEGSLFCAQCERSRPAAPGAKLVTEADFQRRLDAMERLFAARYKFQQDALLAQAQRITYLHSSATEVFQARLEAAQRSYERRWNDQRTAVARMLAESTQELRDQIGTLLARAADQDALIARLRSDLDRQSRLDDLTCELASAVESLVLRQREQIKGLRVRIADLEQHQAAPML